MNSRRPWIRLIVSLGLIFHLGAVFTAPNPSSYLTTALGFVYRPYTNYLGLAHTWGFFAPEPMAPPMFIDYIIDRKGGGQISGRFPDEKDPFFFRDRQNRRLALSRYIMSTDDNIRNMFVRYQCIEQKGALDAIRLWRVTQTPPSLESVRQGDKKMTDTADYKIEVLGTYYCPEKL
ncbi:MAG: hypothetical protein EOP11_22065 [Proteobacteria bacterium]|nr:MAG: hypothetical protein EOP11_22065 [Pseudomonadota bacterium]